MKNCRNPTDAIFNRCKYFGDICNEKLQKSYLQLGYCYCMTYNSSSSDEQESNAISLNFGGCPYVYYSNIVSHRYIHYWTSSVKNL